MNAGSQDQIAQLALFGSMVKNLRSLNQTRLAHHQCHLRHTGRIASLGNKRNRCERQLPCLVRDRQGRNLRQTWHGQRLCDQVVLEAFLVFLPGNVAEFATHPDGGFGGCPVDLEGHHVGTRVHQVLLIVDLLDGRLEHVQVRDPGPARTVLKHEPTTEFEFVRVGVQVRLNVAQGPLALRAMRYIIRDLKERLRFALRLPFEFSRQFCHWLF